MPRPFLPFFVLVALSAGGAVGAEAQVPRGVGAGAVVLERGDELHARMRPRDALEAYRRVLAGDPGHHGALLRTSRECAVLGRLSGDEAEAARWFEEAEELARRAVERDPSSPEARYWLAVALDRLAESGGSREWVERASEIRTHALFVLEEVPAHAGAHHVLGRWHIGTLRLGGVARFFARHVLGREVLEEASWGDALDHLARAVAESPDVLAFRLTLAETYLERERVGSARAQLREILARPSVEPEDPQVKQRAQELLKENP